MRRLLSITTSFLTSAVASVIAAAVIAGVTGVAGAGPARASDFWDEVKNPGLRAYRRHVAEGRAAIAAGRFADALAEAETAATLIPERAPAYVLEGRARGELGQLDTANTSFERAYEIDPESLSALEDGRHAAALLAAGGNYGLAAAILPRVLGRMQASSARVELYALYGDVLSSLGEDRLRDAISAYREAVRQGGTHDPRAALGLALCLRRAGEVDESQHVAAGVSAQGRVDAVLHALPLPVAERAARRAVALMAAGDREGARRAWREASAGEAWGEHATRELAALGASGARSRTRGETE